MFTFSYVVLPWSNLDKNKERNHLFVLYPFWSFTMDQPSCACKCKVQLWPAPPGPLRKALLAWSWGDATRIHRLFRCVSMPSLLQRVPALIRMRGMCVPCLFLLFLGKHKSNKEANKCVQVRSPLGKVGILGRSGWCQQVAIALWTLNASQLREAPG